MPGSLRVSLEMHNCTLQERVFKHAHFLCVSHCNQICQVYSDILQYARRNCRNERMNKQDASFVNRILQRKGIHNDEAVSIQSVELMHTAQNSEAVPIKPISPIHKVQNAETAPKTK